MAAMFDPKLPAAALLKFKTGAWDLFLSLSPRNLRSSKPCKNRFDPFKSPRSPQTKSPKLEGWAVGATASERVRLWLEWKTGDLEPGVGFIIGPYGDPMGISENRGTLFWGPYNKDPTI